MAVVVSMAKDGRDVHPFFMPKTNAGHSVDTGFDGNVKRRKRRRIKSLSNEPTILDPSGKIERVAQPNATSSGPLQESNATHRSRYHQERRNISTIAWTEERRGSSRLKQPVSDGSQYSSSTGSPRSIEAAIPLAEEALQPAGLDLSKDTARTPPKKMLKVRSDGKLSSPKAQQPTQNVKSKRGRKPGKARTVPKLLVATIRYGVDAQSRAAMGYKIANIISGTPSNSSPVKSSTSKSFDPPKPTHPFFLGGSKRDQGQQNVVQCKDNEGAGAEDPSVASKRGVFGPTKARVTSKPPVVLERSAEVFGLGGNISNSDHARTSRFPGALEPLWPPEGMVHVRQDYESAATILPTPHAFHVSKSCRKMKEAEVRISTEEHVLKPYLDTVQAAQSNNDVSGRIHSCEWRGFRRPLRRIVTGRGLQQDVRRKIASKPPILQPDASNEQDSEIMGTPQMTQIPPHPALDHIYNGIATSFTAFDRFECESQDWVHKYAPGRADQVLQAGPEAIILRDWLKTLTISSIGFQANDASTTRDSSVSSRRATTKRKKRRAEELEGFVLSSDEEANEMCQLPESVDRHPRSSMQRRSVIRHRDTGKPSNGDRVTNAVVISGPHGCGKTAAVHAVARELDFEVFEINSGSRRSGKDILDKVGDMTRNHLVKHAPSDQGADMNEEAEDMSLFSEKLKQDLDSGRQGTMNSFFKSKAAPEKSPSKSKPKAQKPNSKRHSPQNQQRQKQSLILLDEVDVLFDEDKAFWATILELLVHSKRPVIMTCTDESLLPLEDMILHAILRFTHAPEHLATDYLLLVACNEGHLLSRDAVTSLYTSKGSDLRASMTELNFFCQMAIGDTKGGLEWMLIQPTNSHDQNLEPLRVVSDGTYQSGMGWLGAHHRTSPAEWSIDQETEMLSEAWYGWDLDIGTCEAYIWPSIPQIEASRILAFQQLQVVDCVAETFSAADTFPGHSPGVPDATSFDTTRPELTEKARSNYIEGFSLLQADPVVDQTGVTEAIAFAVRACAKQLMQIGDKEILDTPVTYETTISMMTENMQTHHSEISNTRFHYAAVFEPIARSNKPVLGISKGPQISAFDGPLSVITEDLAPYVRSIVSYDLRLEEQRGLLSSLLSRPGQIGKRQRTTRASRAALEGGNKAHTRRERWFPDDIHFDLVLESGGQGWQNIALKQAMAESFEDEKGLKEGSRRDSVGSAVESDI